MDDALFKTPEVLKSIPDAAIGGKAAGLLRLQAAGAPVPPWVVLPANAQFDHSEARETLARLVAKLSPSGEGLAVRSSGLIEDQAGASAAGIYETLFCDAAEELPEAIAAVRGSAGAKRAARYHTETTVGTALPHPAERASDLNTMAVILQRRITPRVSGVVFSAHPNRARVDRVLIEAVPGDCAALVDGSATPSRIEVDVTTGATVHIVPGPQGPEQLDECLVATLLGWLLKLEDVFDAALDIEWAVDASGLWLLQARPVTRLALDPALRPPVPATSWFFDQRFHEPIRPITRSSLLPLILRTGIEEALRLRGLAVPDPLAFDYAGQVYINLEAYHHLLRNLPGWLLTPDLRQLYPPHTHPARIPGAGLLVTGLPLLWRERRRVLGNVRAWGHFRDRLGARLADISLPNADDPAAWHAAWQKLDALSEEFLRVHRWSIVLADYAYNAFLLATGLLPRGLRKRMRQRLLTRVRLVTAEANAARVTYTHGSGADVLNRYGHRSASLDYATPTWAEELTGKPWAAPDSSEPEDGTTRSKAGTLVRLLEMREEQRFHWERILARQQALLVSAGHGLHRQGLLAAPDQIWWMEWSELVAALETGSPPDPTDLARRKRAHRIHLPARLPPHLSPQDATASAGMSMEAGQTLRGVGASAGEATGIASVYPRLADLPDRLPEGCILVLPCLDPAWTSLLRSVAGLVIERGGLLSHAAIIAREYGIPLVIGVPEATGRIRTGDVIHVDGDGGMVTRD